MRTYLTEVSNRDWMQEAMALRGYPLVPMDGWDDIATAPRDGTLIRVRQRQWAPCHAKFDGEHWHFTECTSFEPTHWQQALRVINKHGLAREFVGEITKPDAKGDPAP